MYYYKELCRKFSNVPSAKHIKSLLAIDKRSKISQIHTDINNFAGDEACFERHIRKLERAWFEAFPEACQERKFPVSEDFPRWGKSSDDARNMPRQDPQKNRYHKGVILCLTDRDC